MIFPNVIVLLPSSPATGSITIVPPAPGSDRTLRLEPQTVAPGPGIIQIDPVLPFGYKLNDAAPFTAIWAENEVVVIPEAAREYKEIMPELPVEIQGVTFNEGQTELSVDLTIYWCEAINYTLCFVDRKTVIMPVNVVVGAENSALQLAYDLIPPEITGGSF